MRATYCISSNVTERKLTNTRPGLPDFGMVLSVISSIEVNTHIQSKSHSLLEILLRNHSHIFYSDELLWTATSNTVEQSKTHPIQTLLQ